MKNEVTELFKDQEGKLSSTRLALLSWVVIVLIMWAIVSYMEKKLVPIDNSVVTVLGILVSGKVVQRFKEQPLQNEN